MHYGWCGDNTDHRLNGQKTGLGDKANAAGHKLVSDFLKDAFSGKITDYTGSKEGKVTTDKDGNQTITYTITYHDITITYTEGVKKDNNGNGKVQGGSVQ